MVSISNLSKGFIGWLGLSVFILLLDQISKCTVERIVEYGDLNTINSFFNIVHTKNAGAAFSLLANAGGWQRYLFLALSLAISIWLVRALLKRPSLLESASYSFILGGALGNAVDRLWRGSVVDYLDFHWGGYHWPAFNLADAAISIGVFILMLGVMFSGRDPNRVIGNEDAEEDQ